jgi:hypothetical protein
LSSDEHYLEQAPSLASRPVWVNAVLR